ncbi:DEAD-domain-containing protein [Rickenella mellea]|uniref:ATP-dependent RNA helicase n=1 Tax=Rickenella mellea TaxID=50990 RepID=A0A4Y7QEU6_9AGAM|nr:DEAD-domain-containing protein [Rickenella mellea]
MDEGLVLNIAIDNGQAPISRAGAKGGRWTDRVKAKRVAKRKTRAPDTAPSTGKSRKSQDVVEDDNPRPAKKPRTDEHTGRNSTATRSAQPSRPTQFISSLFTSNPEVKESNPLPTPRTTSKPSNAPLTDRSSFAGLGVDPLIITHLSSKMNITAPTAIQKEALPPLLSSETEDAAARDVFISSQTGSGKTLAFLLPIVQDLLSLSSLSYIDRSIGTLAVIIAPTRELAKQIADVLDLLLTLRLRPASASAEDAAESSEQSARLTRWVVAGLLTGGATRTHEKARIRKGLPIIVSTPGRLLDHLQNTASFNVGKCRWLVLDEADRLMELGFEESIQGILKALDGRRKLAMQAVEEGKSVEVGGWDWDRRRRTVLCSATIREDVQHLAGTALVRPIVVKAAELANVNNPLAADVTSEPTLISSTEKFTPPSQLSQKYAIVPLKLRLVALIALLRSLLAQSRGRHGTKIIVFLSCTDSVDYHWQLFGRSAIEDEETSEGGEDDAVGDASGSDSNGDAPKVASHKSETVSMRSSLLPDTSIFRLHGSLPQATRTASLKGFSTPHKSTPFASKPVSPSSSILLCTSVASRGLDLPLVRAVVQYDLPTEGGATEYVHRVGRTARVGKGGEAWSFVSPSERDWVGWIEERIQDEKAEKKVALQSVTVDSILKEGFGGQGKEYEDRATEVQLSFERWVLKRKESRELARKAFQSHVRAYATHPANEKHIFHIRNLHLGHLAKAFALRDAPSSVKGAPTKQVKSQKQSKRTVADTQGDVDKIVSSTKGRHRDWAEEIDGDAERRMRDVVRAQGRLSRKGGVMVTSGTSEFHVPGVDDLERLVARR